MTSLVAHAPIAPARRAYYELPAAELIGDTLILELPKKLESPNKVIWGHWRKLGRERKDLEAMLWAAVCRWRGVLSRAAVRTDGQLGVCLAKMRVTITREVGSAREFIRDDDNLAFSAKPLYDALKRVGLIHDDQRTWLEVAPIEQRVSPDGRPRITIRLERAQ
jgi:hypothetical protein